VSPPASVVYIAPDKMGGMMNIIANLLAYRRPDGMAYHALLTRNRLSADTNFSGRLACDSRTTVEYALPVENLHAVMRRLARAVPRGPGVVVAGDLLDLAMLSVHDLGRAVVLILHGDDAYYYDLAVRHEPVVHAFVVYSRRMHRRLIELLPHRRDTIFYLPYGVPSAGRQRHAADGPVRLVFAGRFSEGKGVLDLPAIDARLRALGVERSWTIIGGGPEEPAMRAAWAGAPGVHFTGPLPNDVVVDRLADHDVFVLPTRSEGLPVALAEAMSVGLVPVASDIPCGVPDLVTDGVHGLLPPVGDVGAFAAAIGRLARDRALLERMSAAARRSVAERFDARARAADYQALFARYPELYRPLRADARLQYGSRLDRAWMPNPVVRAVRMVIRRRAAL
jgi:glycosyltransferase involved in cell wall biosynthesis